MSQKDLSSSRLPKPKFDPASKELPLMSLMKVIAESKKKKQHTNFTKVEIEIEFENQMIKNPF